MDEQDIAKAAFNITAIFGPLVWIARWDRKIETRNKLEESEEQ